MSTPGSNLLAEALESLGTDEFTLYQFDTKSTNDDGITVMVYKLGFQVQASIQAVSRSVYKSMGLNFEKKYLAIWAVQNVEILSSLQPNDQIGFMGRRFNVLSEDNWIPIDLWNNFMAVDIGVDAGDP